MIAAINDIEADSYNLGPVTEGSAKQVPVQRQKRMSFCLLLYRQISSESEFECRISVVSSGVNCWRKVSVLCPPER